MLSSERCYLTKNRMVIGSAFLIPHAAPSCYFLNEENNMQGSGPRLRPGTMMMSNYYLSLFSLFRQASLNDAAEKYYGQAASLRPNVSATTTNQSFPLLFTPKDTVQSHSG